MGHLNVDRACVPHAERTLAVGESRIEREHSKGIPSLRAEILEGDGQSGTGTPDVPDGDGLDRRPDSGCPGKTESESVRRRRELAKSVGAQRKDRGGGRRPYGNCAT